jgi:cyclopropane-fatty-acyl-phospholipid synthase
VHPDDPRSRPALRALPGDAGLDRALRLSRLPDPVARRTRAVARASTLSLYGIDEIGPHYADTLREWRRRFHASRPRLREIGYRDRRFERVWEFYLASCEACFRTHWLRDAQLLLARSDAAPPG